MKKAPAISEVTYRGERLCFIAANFY